MSDEAKVIGKLKRHYMAADASGNAARVRDLENLLTNQIHHYKVRGATEMLDKNAIEAVYKLVMINKELENANNEIQHKMERALESMSPEELALAEKQALELLGLTAAPDGALVGASGAVRPVNATQAASQGRDVVAISATHSSTDLGPSEAALTAKELRDIKTLVARGLKKTRRTGRAGPT